MATDDIVDLFNWSQRKTETLNSLFFEVCPETGIKDDVVRALYLLNAIKTTCNKALNDLDALEDGISNPEERILWETVKLTVLGWCNKTDQLYESISPPERRKTEQTDSVRGTYDRFINALRKALDLAQHHESGVVTLGEAMQSYLEVRYLYSCLLITGYTLPASDTSNVDWLTEKFDSISGGF